jgi:hypothetical protein
MKIEGPARVPGQVTRPGRVAPRKVGDSFASQLAEETHAAAVGQAASAATVQAIVALQEVGDASQQRRRALGRAHDLLDGLEAIKLALLGGRLSASRLGTIAALIRERRESCEDPALDAILADIELRAAVELAKLRQDV